MRNRILFGFMMTLTACTHGPGQDDSARGSPPPMAGEKLKPGSVTPGQPANERAFRVPLVLTQTALLPGTTSVDPTAAAVLLLSPNDPAQVESLLESIASRAAIIPESGEPIAMVAENTSVKKNPEGTVVALRPTRALEPDRWYTFSLDQDETVQLSNEKNAAELAKRSAGKWQSRFFTGSAPHVVRMERPLGEKDGYYVHVVFSEPVSLAQLDAQKLIQIDGRSYGKCVMFNGVCGNFNKDAVADTVDLLLSAPLPKNADQLVIGLDSDLRGASRTVSEGLAVAATGLTKLRTGTLTAKLQGRWHPCQEGASSCFRAYPGLVSSQSSAETVAP